MNPRGNNANYPPAPDPNAPVDHDPDMLLTYPGINDHDQLTVTPEDPRRHDRNWLIRAGHAVAHAVGHRVHDRWEDIRETAHESTEGLRGHGLRHSRNDQRHLHHQLEREATGTPLHAQDSLYASPNQRAGDNTLKDLLSRTRNERERVDIVRRYINGNYYDVTEQADGSKSSVDTRHPQWGAFVDLRNIRLLRNTFRGTPNGDERNLTPSQREVVKQRDDAFAGGLRALSLPIRRAYFTRNPHDVTNQGGLRDDYGFEFSDAEALVDRALRAAQSAPKEFERLVAQATRRHNASDEMIHGHMEEWARRDKAGVYRVPGRFQYDPRLDPRQVANRIAQLDAYLTLFNNNVHERDADQDVAQPFRDELATLSRVMSDAQARASQPRRPVR